MQFSVAGKDRQPFNTGDCLIEVTTWAGFTVYGCLCVMARGSCIIRTENNL